MDWSQQLGGFTDDQLTLLQQVQDVPLHHISEFSTQAVTAGNYAILASPTATPPPSADADLNALLSQQDPSVFMPTSLPQPVPEQLVEQSPPCDSSPEADAQPSPPATLPRRASSARRERHGAELATFQKERFPQSSRDTRYPDFLEQLLQCFEKAKDDIGGGGDVQFSREALKDARTKVSAASSTRGWRIWLKEPLFNRFRDVKQCCTPPDTTHAEFVELLLDLHDLVEADDWQKVRESLLHRRSGSIAHRDDPEPFEIGTATAAAAANAAMQNEALAASVQQALQQAARQSVASQHGPTSAQFIIPDATADPSQLSIGSHAPANGFTMGPAGWTLTVGNDGLTPSQVEGLNIQVAALQPMSLAQKLLDDDELSESSQPATSTGTLPGRAVRRSLSSPGLARPRGIPRAQTLPTHQDYVASNLSRTKSLSAAHRRGRENAAGQGLQRRSSLRGNGNGDDHSSLRQNLLKHRRNGSEASTASVASTSTHSAYAVESPLLQSVVNGHAIQQWPEPDGIMQGVEGITLGEAHEAALAAATVAIMEQHQQQQLLQQQQQLHLLEQQQRQHIFQQQQQQLQILDQHHQQQQMFEQQMQAQAQVENAGLYSGDMNQAIQMMTFDLMDVEAHQLGHGLQRAMPTTTAPQDVLLKYTTLEPIPDNDANFGSVNSLLDTTLDTMAMDEPDTKVQPELLLGQGFVSSMGVDPSVSGMVVDVPLKMEEPLSNTASLESLYTTLMGGVEEPNYSGQHQQTQVTLGGLAAPNGIITMPGTYAATTQPLTQHLPNVPMFPMRTTSVAQHTTQQYQHVPTSFTYGSIPQPTAYAQPLGMHQESIQINPTPAPLPPAPQPTIQPILQTVIPDVKTGRNRTNTISRLMGRFPFIKHGQNAVQQ